MQLVSQLPFFCHQLPVKKLNESTVDYYSNDCKFKIHKTFLRVTGFKGEVEDGCVS